MKVKLGEIAAIISLAIIIILVMCAFSIPAKAQTSFDTPGSNMCLYHWDTISGKNPAFINPIVMGKPKGWATPVPAIGYLGQLSRFNNPQALAEKAVVSIQYSFAANPLRSETAGKTLIVAHLTGPDEELAVVPKVTVRETMFEYLFGGDYKRREEYGRLLVRMVNDVSNKPCNPWKIY